MTNQEKVALLLAVTHMIFVSKEMNSDITDVTITTNLGTFNGRWFGNGQGGGTLRGFDFTVADKGQQIPLRVIEQNPNKTDRFGNLKTNAILARQGHKIAWVIRRDTNTFLGKVQDGKWIKNQPRALTRTVPGAVPGTGNTQPVTAQDQYNERYANYNGQWKAELPEIDPKDIPFYVTGV